jgi:predicted ATPase/class 3 adenylate cyclase
VAQRSFAFLFTDIEGSTRLWETEPEGMARSLAEHDRLLRIAIEKNAGRVFKTVGDAFCAAFETSDNAAAAALDIQRALLSANWDSRTGRLKVRIGIHAGPAEERDDDYFGPALNRTGRIQSVAYGDQILLSESAVAGLRASGTALRDLGSHRLKDLQVAERIYQLDLPERKLEFPELRTLDVRRTNLPIAANPLVGREFDLESAAKLVRERALLTISGTGGVGKTRFALQLCAEVADRFPDGVWFVDLSAIERGEFVASSVAKALGIVERFGQALPDTIADSLAGARSLILLDNCEHVVEAAARLVSACVAAAPDVRFIATSREPLALASEQLLRLDPLALPQAGCTPEQQLAAPSIRLFIERARAVRPDIEIGGNTLGAIVEVCRRLDGLPLAIELAAARTALFDVKELSRRTDDLLRLLIQRKRDAAPRQANLEALIDWSYRLLEDRERRTLDDLAVFAGRFTLDAAVAICADVPDDAFDVEDALESLVQKSFVAVEDAGGVRGLRLYETIRQFAERRLRLSEERTQTVVARHIAHYDSLARATTDEAREDFAAFGADLDNIRVALRRAGDRDGFGEARAQLALAIGRYGLQSGAIGEGLAALEDAYRAGVGDARTRLWIDFNLGEYALYRERADIAREHYERVAAAGSAEMTGRAQYGLAMVERSLEHFESAAALIESSIANLEPEGPSFGLTQAYTALAQIELARGERAAARAAAERALVAARAIRHPRVTAIALGNVAMFAFHAGELAAARRLIDETIAATDRAGAHVATLYYTGVRAEIALFDGAGDPRPDALTALTGALDAQSLDLAARAAETLATLEALDGHGERAASLFAWAEGGRAAGSILIDDDDRAIVARKRALARCEAPARVDALARFNATPPEELLASLRE